MRIVGIVLRNHARRLLALLLLLALIAGGQSSSAIAMTMDMDMGKMQMGDMDQGCKACNAPIATPCDAACTALPAIDVAPFSVDEFSLHEHWSNRSKSGISVFVRPDTSPPRA